MGSTAELLTVRDRYTDDEIASYYATGAWQPQGIFDLVDAQGRTRSDDLFVSDGTSSLTFGQLREQALRLAAGLSRLGVAKGDRVGVQLPNWTEFATITAALARLGAITVPMMPALRDTEVGYLLEHSGARLLIGPERFHGFVYPEMYERVRARCPDLTEVVVVRGDGDLGRDLAFEDVFVDGPLEQIDAGLGAGSSGDDGLMIVYTSGTTARPKGCFHTFNTVHACAVAMIDRLHMDSSDVFFNPSPVAHSTGLVTGLAMPLIAGASTHFMEAWEPDAGLRQIAEYRCTMTVTATTFLSTLMGAYDPQRHDMSTMRTWVCAGSPIPGVVVQSARDLFPGCDVLSLYGRSENFITTMCRLEDPAESSVTSDGVALPGMHVKVVDESGQEVRRGRSGDLAFAGPSHMLGYYREPAETAALFTADGFSRSGDLGYMDEDGYVRVNGRLKDIIIRGGFNISSREIEDLLMEHPSVKDVAVVAMPDERLGERMCAYVVPVRGEPEPTLPDLTAFLRRHQIAVQKLPERLELLPELPMTPAGKVRKNVLRQDIATRLAAQRTTSAGG